ncbi:MAG: NADP-binding protein [Deltaproteobacteria bacterium]|nr:NADP-binding protein [Deltaproteobacteria bacterium]
MRSPVRVLVVGHGRMGSAIARLVHERPGLELVGVCERHDVTSTIEWNGDPGCRLGSDLSELVEVTRPEIAIQATCSRLDEVVEDIETLLGHGVHVISIAEEMVWPRASSPEVADRLDALARAKGVGVLGTGVNPGFVLDLLIITLTGVCANVESIRAERVNDLSPYGASVLRAQGVGLTPVAFRKGVAEGTVAGHHGFPQSIGMIAESLGWEIERIEETREPLLAKKRRETEELTVEPGDVAGCLHTAVAYRQGRPAITLIHPQLLHPHLDEVETADVIEIKGSPDLRIEGHPEIPGGTATAALAVNMIPRLLAAEPGLKSMADLPVPAATVTDVRRLMEGERRGDHG